MLLSGEHLRGLQQDSVSYGGALNVVGERKDRWSSVLLLLEELAALGLRRSFFFCPDRWVDVGVSERHDGWFGLADEIVEVEGSTVRRFQVPIKVPDIS